MQIRENGKGTYPPVVYQPLRSPKSPYSKFGPGSSCTLPAKLGARLMNAKNDRARTKRLLNDSLNTNRQNNPIPEHKQESSNLLQSTEETNADLLLPRFLHHPAYTYTTYNTNNDRKLPYYQQRNHEDHLGVLHNNNNDDSFSQSSSTTTTTTTTTTTATIDQEHYSLKSTNKNKLNHNTRGSSEENSHSGSDHSNGGYFSEDSSQSVTDLCGSPFELKVQLRQCSDEKILKKNFSSENLLKADYISRPNEKCKYDRIRPRCLNAMSLHIINPLHYIVLFSIIKTCFCLKTLLPNTNYLVSLISKWEPDNMTMMLLRKRDIDK